jgi:hypothetical protein
LQIKRETSATDSPVLSSCCVADVAFCDGFRAVCRHSVKCLKKFHISVAAAKQEAELLELSS